MSFKSWSSYWAFSRSVKLESRYIHSASATEFLSNVLATCKDRLKTVNAGTIFWRSQLGNDWKQYMQDDIEVLEEPTPFPPKRMIPILYEALEGRANPKGIPYLYLATDKETAMSEVRPWIGSNISVGQFKTVKELRVVDCSLHHSKGDVFYIEEPREEKRKEAVWAYIDKAFSAPVTQSDKSSDYIPTQIIAELFKNEGFDGVVYKSALSNGDNLVLFNINSAELINCFLYETKDIKFSFSETANPYYVKKR